MNTNKDLNCVDLVRAVIRVQELCSNRKNCKGCIFDLDVMCCGSFCAIGADPYLWRLNNIKEYLNTHNEESEETK